MGGAADKAALTIDCPVFNLLICVVVVCLFSITNLTSLLCSDRSILCVMRT